MFKCGICGSQTKKGDKATRIIAQTRPRTYPQRLDVFRYMTIQADGRRKKVVRDDPGGEGNEIASEVLACPACADMDDWDIQIIEDSRNGRLDRFKEEGRREQPSGVPLPVHR